MPYHLKVIYISVNITKLENIFVNDAINCRTQHLEECSFSVFIKQK